MGYPKWKQWEYEYLLNNYGLVPMDELCVTLNRKRSAIIQYAYTHNISSNRYFSREEHEYIISHMGIKSFEEIGKKLNRQPEAIRTHAFRNGYTHTYSNSRITQSEASNLVHRDKETLKRIWTKYGLKIFKVGRHSMIPINNLLDVMKNNPKLWDATDCESWYFRKYDWFTKKRESDFNKLIERKWGK